MIPPRQGSTASLLAGRILATPRPYVYLICTVLTLAISYFLGKDTQWDTREYHFYAGFSALHDRFRQDYFPAGSQSYFNPYAYVPFYLLARSKLPALAVASILAAVQSVILWLTYELALEVAPAGDRQTRLMMAVGAVLLALANPILINQFGSSYADITTGEIALAGWLLLVRAVGSAGQRHIILAGLLLGAASALKLTNLVHAVSACVLLLFLREDWRGKVRSGATFGAAVLIGVGVTCLPWSIHLERQFGNPLFPLFNSIFRSPHYPTARMMDYRFIPDSLAGALWRPFAIAVPHYMVDDESQSPDIRYAVLLAAAVIFTVLWFVRRLRRETPYTASGGLSVQTRALAALSCAFLIDWTLWLAAAANGRYFIPLACVAAVIAVALVFRILDRWSKVRGYVLAAIVAAQVLQLCLGTVYRDHVPWGAGPWFDVEVPAALATKPALYLSYGVQANAFIAPFLDPRSGFINLAGDYPLGSGGANGAAVASRIRRYSPNLRVLARVLRLRDEHLPVISDLWTADFALEPFHLRTDPNDCSTILIRDEGQAMRVFVGAAPTTRGGPPAAGPGAPRSARLSDTGYLASCRVVPYVEAPHPNRLAAEREANFVLDRLEDTCPELFQPARPITQYFGRTKHHGYILSRRYLNTNLTAWASNGWVAFIDPLRGGPATYIGPVNAFERTSLRIACGRRDERYYAKVVQGTH